MTPNEYQKEVQRTLMSPAEQAYKIIQALKEKPRLAHIIVGGAKLCSEAGELNDSVVKHICYGQPLDEENIIEECGDLLWYIGMILLSTNANLEDVMGANIEKLRIRYPEKFTEKDALERKDKI